MKNTIRTLWVLALFGATAFAQEDYSTWAKHKNVIMNTAISGANIATNVKNFPVLVTLGASDTAVFNNSVGRGADLRFSKANVATHIPYQIESWDSAGKSAAIWVLIDTVYGNVNNQSVKMHWGKSGTSDSSNGSQVFKTTNGFQAVWHMNGGVGTENDATANGFTATPSATAPTSNSQGAIGSARTFNGSSSYLVALNTATGALNFPQGGPATLSTWINSTTNGQKVIVGKSDYQYSLQLNSGSNYESCDYQDAQGWYCVASDQPPTGQWIHYVSVFNADAESLYVNGVLVGSAPTLGSNGAARNQTYNVFIGAMVSGTAPGTVAAGTKSRYWTGSIDEVELSSVARSSTWITLQYLNQKAGQTFLTLADSVPAFAVGPTVVSRTAVQNAAQGGAAKFGVSVTGTGTMTFKWVKNNTDTVRTINGTGSDTLTLTGVVLTDNNATYKCVVSNSIGVVVSSSATLTVNVAVAVSAQPSPKSVNQGGTTSYAITATGTNLSFKWVKNNTDTVRTATGGTGTSSSDTLVLTGVAVSDNGATYKCVVSNALGSVVSTAAGLQVVGVLPGGAANSFGILNMGSSLMFRFPSGITGAQVSILDIWGRTVWSRKVGAGVNQLSWDGRNNGHSAGAGIYLVRVSLSMLNQPTRVIERKALLTP